MTVTPNTPMRPMSCSRLNMSNAVEAAVSFTGMKLLARQNSSKYKNIKNGVPMQTILA